MLENCNYISHLLHNLYVISKADFYIFQLQNSSLRNFRYYPEIIRLYGSVVRIAFSLVLNSLWERGKKWNSLSRNKENSRNFLAYIFIKFILKVKKKENKYLKKNLHILETQLLTPHLIFIAFLCINIFQIANFSISSPPKAQF